jgi:hypothetical protein
MSARVNSITFWALTALAAHILTKVLDYFVEKHGGYDHFMRILEARLPEWISDVAEFLVGISRALASDFMQGFTVALLLVAVLQWRGLARRTIEALKRRSSPLSLSASGSTKGGSFTQGAVTVSYNSYSMLVKNKSKRQIKSIDVYATISFIVEGTGSVESMEFHPIKIHRIDDIPPGGTADFEFLGTFSAQIIDNARGRSAFGGGYFFPEIGIKKSFDRTWSPNMKIQYSAVSDGIDVGQAEIYLPESVRSSV